MTGPELAQWRAESRLTQPALALLLGVHPITVANWERGYRGIPPYLRLAIVGIETLHGPVDNAAGLHAFIPKHSLTDSEQLEKYGRPID